MKIKNLKIRIGAGLVVLVLGYGCKSSDEGESGFERMKIEMEDADVESSRDIDWNNAKVVWSDDFDGSTLSEDNWSHVNNSSNPNVSEQLQNYTTENAEVSGGILKIQVKKVGDGQKKGDYTSARISSDLAFKYGRIEVRAKLPQAEKNGIWAKLTLIGENETTVGWPKCGEINLMEYLSHSPNETYVTVHSDANNSAKSNLISSYMDLETAEEEFHTYGLLWTENYLKFYIDDPDNITFTLNKPSPATATNWPFDQPFYLLADVVVGGRFGGLEGVDDTLFPTAMEVEYMRVYHAQ